MFRPDKHPSLIWNLLLAAALGVATTGTVACSTDDGPGEAIEEAGDEIEEATDEVD
jgi:predicted small secreted protein